MASVGRKLPRSRPTMCNSRNHSQSDTSLLRPGTFLTCRALTSSTSNAARLQDLVHRDPVDAGRFHGDARHATRRQPVGEAHQITGERRNDCTGMGSRSGGTATKCSAEPQSIPATLGLMRSSTVGDTRGLPDDGGDCVSSEAPPYWPWSIREQGGGIESILPNGITCVSPRVSPMMQPQLPGPRWQTGSPAPVAGRPRFPDAASSYAEARRPPRHDSVSDLMRRDRDRVGRWQGATSKNTWAYLREEQRRQAGCSTGRMQQDLRDETLVPIISSRRDSSSAAG